MVTVHTHATRPGGSYKIEGRMTKTNEPLGFFTEGQDWGKADTVLCDKKKKDNPTKGALSDPITG